MADLHKTALYSRHLQLGAKMVPFAGFSMPVHYTGLLEEAKATRKVATLFDVSHMGQFWVRGSKALQELQHLTTNDVGRLSVGQAQYNMLCDEKGGVIDDIVVYRRHEKEFFICVNASNRAIDWEWFCSHATRVEDESDQTSLLALQGPAAPHILRRIDDKSPALLLKYYWGLEAQLLGIDVFISRTGYTGEDGFEIYIHSEKAGELWDTLLEIGQKEGLVAAGLGARDLLRTEMGYPLHGHELSREITPMEAGLSWVVKFNKDFIGKSVLEKQAKEGPPRRLCGLTFPDRRIPRTGYRIFAEGNEVGSITSGTFSPHLSRSIGLGLVDFKFSDRKFFDVQIREEMSQATVESLPFVQSRTRRLTTTDSNPLPPII